jgi:hypothetical protein
VIEGSRFKNKWLLVGLYALSMSAECLASEVTAPDNLRFEPVDFSLKGTDRIGTLKAGFVCLPSGTLRWEDIRLPRDSELAQRALAEVKKTGLILSTSQHQIKGRVDKFELKLCVAGLGVGEKKPTGRGKIEVQWTQSSWPGGTEIKSKVIDSEFDVDGIDPRKDSELLQKALVKNLLMFLDSKTTN